METFELKRNCLHGGTIAVYQVERDGQLFVRKVGFREADVTDLEREAAGLEWYRSRTNRSARGTINYGRRGAGYFVEAPWVMGLQPDYTAGLERNARWIDAAVRHYVEVWPRSHLVPLHGDYCLDNILFDGQDVHVLDWEHFSNNAVPWGFDALYLVAVTARFDHGSPSWGCRAMLEVLGRCVGLLEETGCLRQSFHQSPLTATYNFVSEHLPLWGSQVAEAQAKLPILALGRARWAALDDLLRERASAPPPDRGARGAR